MLCRLTCLMLAVALPAAAAPFPAGCGSLRVVDTVPEGDAAPEPDADGTPAPPSEEGDEEEPEGSPGCPYDRNELDLLA